MPVVFLVIAIMDTGMTTQSACLNKHIQPLPPSTTKAASGIWRMADGQTVLDSTSGAAVSASGIGQGNVDVTKTMVTQLDQIAYCHPEFYQTDIVQDLSTSSFLVNSTGGKMQKALLTGSGTFPCSSYAWLNSP